MKVCGYQWGDCAAEVMAWSHRCVGVSGHRGEHVCRCEKRAPEPHDSGSDHHG